jgi:PIN domain nuclease of toxin-antitoxin system
VKLLLDTHVFLWWLERNPRLSARAGALIADPDCEVFVSIVTVWEIAIKAGLGQLEMPVDLGGFLRRELARNGFETLPITFEHAVAARNLPPHHRDPFDRLLICQSHVEMLGLVSADPALAAYGADVVW